MQLLEMGGQAQQAGRGQAQLGSLTRDTVATLVFTSGTTKAPKAAALAHGNILYQVEQFPFYLQVRCAVWCH